MDGWMEGQMDRRNFSPFYRSLSPVWAAALLPLRLHDIKEAGQGYRWPHDAFWRFIFITVIIDSNNKKWTSSYFEPNWPPLQPLRAMIEVIQGPHLLVKCLGCPKLNWLHPGNPNNCYLIEKILFLQLYNLSRLASIKKSIFLKNFLFYFFLFLPNGFPRTPSIKEFA